MKRNQCWPMTYCNTRAPHLLDHVAKTLLHLHRHTTGALVKDGKTGLVVEETSHAQALLLPQGQHVTPVDVCVIGGGVGGAVKEVFEVNGVEEGP